MYDYRVEKNNIIINVVTILAYGKFFFKEPREIKEKSVVVVEKQSWPISYQIISHCTSKRR